MYDVDYNVVAQTVIVPKEETSLIITPERPLKNVFIKFTCAMSQIQIKINDTDLISPFNDMSFDFSKTNLVVKKIEFLLNHTADTNIYYQGIN
jgi:hypothetical protein